MDAPDFDAWEAEEVKEVDPAAGQIPAWLEACLHTDATACPLHSTAAYSVLMKFLIGSDTLAGEVKGFFCKELSQTNDDFGQIDIALEAITASHCWRPTAGRSSIPQFGRLCETSSIKLAG